MVRDQNIKLIALVLQLVKLYYYCPFLQPQQPTHNSIYISYISYATIVKQQSQRYNKESNTSAFSKELTELYLSGKSFKNSLLQLRHKFQHFEQFFPLNLLLHSEEHLVDSPHNIEYRVALLVDIMHPIKSFFNPPPLRQPENVLDLVDRWGIADVQYVLIGNDLSLSSEVAGLDVVDCLPHVPIGDEEQCLEGLLRYLHVLPLHHPLQVQLHFALLQLPEPKDDATTLDRLYDLRGCVAAQHKSSGLAEVAYYHPQGVLRPFSETIRFVENDYFGFSWRKRYLFLSKGFDLISHDIDASLIGGIQLKSGFFELAFEQFPDDTQHTGCFADTGRACQNEVRNGALSHASLESINLLDVAVDFSEGFGTILFQPNLFHLMAQYYNYRII